MEGVVTIDEQRAEELKTQGNEEFKKGNHIQAIDLYTQAIGIKIINNHSFKYRFVKE